MAASKHSGLQARAGAVLTSIVVDLGILERGFLSCIDVEFEAHGFLLDAAVLLDANHPGVPPAALPDMRPVPRHPGFFDRPDTIGSPGARAGKGPFYPGPMLLNGLTARRVGDAWLVVEGGTGT